MQGVPTSIYEWCTSAKIQCRVKIALVLAKEQVLCLLRGMQLFNPGFIMVLHTGRGKLEESLSPDALPCTARLSPG